MFVGIGKTSLIHAIARSSEHVVHIDSSTTPASTGFEEIHASTRSQPWWAADTGVNGQASGRRRVSMQTEVLDRNICFVDVLPSHPSSSVSQELDYIPPISAKCLYRLHCLMSSVISRACLESLSTNTTRDVSSAQAPPLSWMRRYTYSPTKVTSSPSLLRSVTNSEKGLLPRTSRRCETSKP